MNRVDHDFYWNVFKNTDFIFRKLFNNFYHFFLLEFPKSKFFFAIKMLLNLFDRLIFELFE